MSSRIELQTKLEELLGSSNVYYQPPENLKMSYPAIVYSLDDIKRTSADDVAYLQTRCYEIIVVDKKPDNVVIDKILNLPLCDFNRHYVADNLNHYVFKLYF